MSVLPRLGKLIANRTALLVCDIQEKFRHKISHFDAVTANSGRLIAAARILEMPIFITEMYPQGLWLVYGLCTTKIVISVAFCDVGSFSPFKA